MGAYNHTFIVLPFMSLLNSFFFRFSYSLFCFSGGKALNQAYYFRSFYSFCFFNSSLCFYSSYFSFDLLNSSRALAAFVF